jgi:hypothetical protein
VRAFRFGFILAAPWALGNVANGPFPEDHMTHGCRCGCTASGRGGGSLGASVCLCAALLVVRRYARANAAVPAAVILGALWFAFLHAPVNPLAMVLLASIQVLPITFLWLRRGLRWRLVSISLDLVRF